MRGYFAFLLITVVLAEHNLLYGECNIKRWVITTGGYKRYRYDYYVHSISKEWSPVRCQERCEKSRICKGFNNRPSNSGYGFVCELVRELAGIGRVSKPHSNYKYSYTGLKMCRMRAPSCFTSTCPVIRVLVGLAAWGNHLGNKRVYSRTDRSPSNCQRLCKKFRKNGKKCTHGIFDFRGWLPYTTCFFYKFTKEQGAYLQSAECPAKKVNLWSGPARCPPGGKTKLVNIVLKH